MPTLPSATQLETRGNQKGSRCKERRGFPSCQSERCQCPFRRKKQGLEVVKRIEANVPVESPRRADVFKALAEKAIGNRIASAEFADSSLKLALRYANKQDVKVLVDLFENFKDSSVSETIARRLGEYQHFLFAERMARDLTLMLPDQRRHASQALRAFGEPAERIVQEYCSPNVRSMNRDECRRDAFRILGDIGTQDSVQHFSYEFRNDSPR